MVLPRRRFKPLILHPSDVGVHQTTFYLPGREVRITLPRSLVRRLLTLCEGIHSEEAIIESLSTEWRTKDLKRLFLRLREAGVLVDGNDITTSIWQFVKNPTAWTPRLQPDEIVELALSSTQPTEPTAAVRSFTLEATPWTDLLNARRTRRNFGAESPSEASLVRLLWSGYGVLPTKIDLVAGSLHRRTVPSAGALYPLTLGLFLFRPLGSLEQGAYRVHVDYPGRIGLARLDKVSGPLDDAFVDFSSIRDAAGAIILSGSFGRSARKYANRGMLYAILEAGHAAQNIHVAAQIDGLATVEVGGFFEAKLAHLLQLDTAYVPLTTIVFGTQAESSPDQQQLGRSLELGDIIRQIEHAAPEAGGYRLPFEMVFAKIATSGSGDPGWSCGRSVKFNEALTKAQAEAIEWFSFGRAQYHDLIGSPYSELKGTAVHPELVICYAPDQFAQTQRLKPFDPNARYEWRSATDIEAGSTTWVLADHIYFPYIPRFGRRYAYANSSGAAAHITVERAVERGLLELVERDAFMITWLNRLSPPRVSTQSLPAMVQQRVRALAACGFEVSIGDLTLDLTPVLLVTAFSKGFSFFTCATASTFDVAEALDRALMEVEAAVYCRLRDGGARRLLVPDEAFLPEDHAALYENRKNIEHALFLRGSGSRRVSLGALEHANRIRSVPELQTRFRDLQLRSYCVEMSEKDPALGGLPFHVVKMLVPGLVPMSFGVGLEPLGLARVRRAPVACGKLQRLLRFERLNRFPHPFA